MSVGAQHVHSGFFWPPHSHPVHHEPAPDALFVPMSSHRVDFFTDPWEEYARRSRQRSVSADWISQDPRQGGAGGGPPESVPDQPPTYSPLTNLDSGEHLHSADDSNRTDYHEPTPPAPQWQPPQDSSSPVPPPEPQPEPQPTASVAHVDESADGHAGDQESVSMCAHCTCFCIPTHQIDVSRRNTSLN